MMDIRDEKMKFSYIMDIRDEIIFNNSYHELEILKNMQCVTCTENFQNKIHKNKKKFKKDDMSFYSIKCNNNTYYCHGQCLETMFEQYINEENRIVINNEYCDEIKLLNRHGETMTKVNYLTKVTNWLKAKTFENFKNAVSHLYKTHVNYSFHCVEHYFKKEKLNEFNEIQKNFIYRGQKVDWITDPNSIFI